MDNDKLVETIMREVKRVLTERGITVKSGIIPQPVSGYNKVDSIPKPTVSASSGDITSVGMNDLAGKQVITQKDLEAYKGQTINVTGNAVITPLAHDYAKDKKITINRVKKAQSAKESLSPSAGSVSVALAIAPDFKGNGSVLKKILASKHLGVIDFSDGSYEANVRKVAEAALSGNVNFGICLENTGMEAPIIANRNSRIRAVHCRETFDARAARVDIGANVIVLDSSSNPEAIISGFMGL